MKMKKPIDLQTVIIALLLVALCVTIYQIAELKEDVQTLKMESRSRFSDLCSQISGISDEMEELLTEQVSILSDAEYVMGQFDPETMTCGINFTIVPKLLTEDMAVTVTLGNESAELVREGNTFRGTLMLGLFLTEENHPMVGITSDGQTRTEVMEELWIEELWRKVLPSLNASMNYYCTQTDKALTVNGRVELFFDPVVAASNVSFTKFEYVTLHDGQELSREDVSADVLALQDLGNGVYRGDFDRTYDSKPGQTLEVYVEATDSLGYIHRYLLIHLFEEDGDAAQEVWFGEQIYDSEGNLLSRE